MVKSSMQDKYLDPIIKMELLMLLISDTNESLMYIKDGDFLG